MANPTTFARLPALPSSSASASQPGPLQSRQLTTVAVAAARQRSVELEQQLAADPRRFRVLTGDRPTGRLHLGHYVGTLANRVRLQAAGVQVFVAIADYQVLTDRDIAEGVRAHVRELLLDYLAAGIVPRTDADGPGTADRTAAATIFTHSAVPALNQLLLPFLSLVSEAELRRNPTVKSEAAAAAQRTGRGRAVSGRAVSGLLLTYPVHQAADILFCGANLAPVGQDQLPHLELTRQIARRFNDRYAAGRTMLSEPEALLSAAPLLLGTDGTKMSKSAGNTIPLGATEDQTARLIRAAITDGDRRITYDPATRPQVANLLLMAACCTGRTPHELAEDIGDGGAAALKRVTTEAINEHLRPLRTRRKELATADDYLRHVLAAGNAHASTIAERTLCQVRHTMGMIY
jgi:tryptophanyl-tRNA synthetase